MDYDKNELNQAKQLIRENRKQRRHETAKGLGMFFASKVGRWIAVGLIVVLVLSVGWLGYDRAFHNKTVSHRLGFHDIGELATQESIVTVIGVEDTDKTMWNVHIPFTQSKYIYSLDVAIKAGYDFEKINCKETSETEYACTMPEPKILSSELKTDTFQVYHESESIFNRITLEENNSFYTKMEEQAKKDAIENGLFDRTEANAKTIIEAMIKGSAGQDVEVTFQTKK